MQKYLYIEIDFEKKNKLASPQYEITKRDFYNE